jgi:hypothetical protein
MGRHMKMSCLERLNCRKWMVMNMKLQRWMKEQSWHSFHNLKLWQNHHLINILAINPPSYLDAETIEGFVGRLNLLKFLH